MRFVVPDDYDGFGRLTAQLDRLRAHGEVLVSEAPPKDEDELLARLAGADVVLAVRERTRLDRKRLDALPALRMISVLGTATTAIDFDAARERGVVVRTTPAVSDVAVAEHALGLMLALAKRIPFVDAGTRGGRWPETVGSELFGKTLGIVGLGSIGRRVARLARAFDMNVLAWGRSLTAETAEEAGARACSLDELLEASDFVSVHVRLSPETRGLLSRARLERLKPHAYLVNTARAEIADEDALRDLLAANRIGGAALDVFVGEPVRDARWSTFENVVVTSHRAWVTRETVDRLFGAAVDNVLAWLAER